jgi:hypothetical protein
MENQKEIFKVIKNYRNYAVSNMGNVKNTKTNRILKQTSDKAGYKYLNLYADKKPTTFFTHTLVMGAFGKKKPTSKKEIYTIDHIDGSKDNNCISNLRWATKSEQKFNQKIPSTNTTGFKGVSLVKKTKKEKVGDEIKEIPLKQYYTAYIKVNKKFFHLGSFETKEEAVKARLEASKQMFKEFQHSCEKNVVINPNPNPNPNPNRIDVEITINLEMINI